MGESASTCTTSTSLLGRTTAAVAGTLLAAAGSAVAAAGAARAGVAATTFAGEPALLLALLAVLTAATALTCAYLTVIAALAAVVLVSRGCGPTGRRGLTLLRTLAPSLARRIAASAMVASAATGLSTGVAHADPVVDATAPAVAAAADPGADGPSGVEPIRTAGLVTDRPALAAALRSTPVPTTPAEDASGDDEDESDERPATDTAPSQPAPSDPDAPDLPPLGWAEPAPDPVHVSAPTDEAPPREGDPHPVLPERAPHIVVVERGDCLWGIADDLLGPGRDADADVASAWPVLYEANRTVIGTDPDHIEPGQQLTVPAGFPAPESAPQEPR